MKFRDIFLFNRCFRKDYFEPLLRSCPSLQFTKNTDRDIMLEARQPYESINFQWLAPQQEALHVPELLICLSLEIFLPIALIPESLMPNAPPIGFHSIPIAFTSVFTPRNKVPRHPS